MRGAASEGRMAQGIEGNSWPQRERGRMDGDPQGEPHRPFGGEDGAA